MSEELIYFNGINGSTGDYLISPEKVSQVAAKIPRDKPALPPASHEDEDLLGLPEGVDPKDIRQAGWAVVFHEQEKQEVRAALQPLIEHRRRQIGNDKIARVLEYKSGEDIADFLGKYGAAPGEVAPNCVPYYLLLVGDPEKIPFDLGHFLDVEYCVGRLHFDKASKYENYVKGVISYETEATVPRQREVAFFAPRNEGDAATGLSADKLVKPLSDGIPSTSTEAGNPWVGQGLEFRAKKIWGPDATKDALGNLFRSTSDGSGPAFLLTASHGVGWDNGDPRQADGNGALVCQGWKPGGSLKAEHYFAASDIPSEASFSGMINFHFACYGAGTPKYDPFFHEPGQAPPQIAPVSFLSALPCAMLSHSNGGSLAAIGHVERAWGYSFIAPKVGPQLGPFRNAITRILKGFPVGFAMQDFNEKYSIYSVLLSALLERIGHGETVPDKELASKWIQRNDAQSYVVIGDPAVRLRLDQLR